MNNDAPLTNRQKFVAAYAVAMKANSDANPGQYMIPASWEALAEKMTASLIAGTANLSNVGRATLRKLGGKPTYAGAVEFLTK